MTGRSRTQGLLPIQFWVPDVCASSFPSEVHRQSQAAAASANAAEDQAFIDAPPLRLAVEPTGRNGLRAACRCPPNALLF